MIKIISRTLDTIMVVDDGAVKTARSDHPKWEDINKTFNRITYEGDHFTGPVDELLALMDLKTAVETYTVGRLSVNALGVIYGGRLLHTIDAERVMAFMRDKLSYHPIANYIERKMKNPSARAIAEMYNFLEHRGMSLTSKGTFIAYKGVTNDLWSIKGNTNTVVLQGEISDDGKIRNAIGATIEVERSSVDDDFRQGCSYGLHVGSLEYAKGWGQRVVLVEVDPADVVSVPEDCNCQKLRCCKYTVLAEYTGPMPDTLTTEFDDEDVCHQCGAPEDECICPVAVPPPNVTKDETPDESWIQEKAAVEDKHIVLTGGMNSNTIVRVCAIIAEQVGVNLTDILPDTRMNSNLLMLDSLDAVELTMALEEEFKIEIPDEDMDKAIFATVADICKYIDERLAPTPNADPIYNMGRAAGWSDKTIGRMSIYVIGDETGADSPKHVQYILGYVAGYSSK